MGTLKDFLDKAKDASQAKYTSAVRYVLLGTNLASIHNLNPTAARAEDVEKALTAAQDSIWNAAITDPPGFRAGREELAESIKEYPLDFRRYIMMGHLLFLECLLGEYHAVSAPIPPGPSIFKVNINFDAFHNKASGLKDKAGDFEKTLAEHEIRFVLDHIHQEQRKVFENEPLFIQRLIYISLRQKENRRKIEDFERERARKSELLKLSGDRPVEGSYERMFDNLIQALSYYLIAIKCDPDYFRQYEGDGGKALIRRSLDRFEERLISLGGRDLSIRYSFLRTGDDYEVERSRVSLDKSFFLKEDGPSLSLNRGNIVYLIDNRISVILSQLDEHLKLKVEQAVESEGLEVGREEFFDNYVRQRFLETYVSTSQGSIYALRRLGDLILQRAEVEETDRILLESIEDLDADSVRRLFTKYGISLDEGEGHWKKLDEAKKEAKRGKKRLIDKLKSINDHYMRLQGNCKILLDAIVGYLRSAIRDGSYDYDALIKVLGEKGYRPESDRLVETFGESYFIKDEKLRKIFTLTRSIWATGTDSLLKYHATVKNIIDIQTQEGGWLNDSINAANNAAGTWMNNYRRAGEELVGFFHKELAKRAFVAPELKDFVKRRRVWEGKKDWSGKVVPQDLEGALKRLSKAMVTK
jgi:hypothetical protein